MATVVALAVPAAASYELSLIYDLENRQILRYDPVSNRPMGAFGAGLVGYYGNEVKLARDPLRPGTITTLNVSGNLRWLDYSTGIAAGSLDLDPTGSMFVNGFQFTATGNLLVTESSGLVRLFNRSGTPQLSFTQYSGYTTLDAIQLPSGRFATLERTISGSDYKFHLFQRDAAGQFVNGLFDWRISGAANHFRRLGFAGSRVVATGLSTFPEVGIATIDGTTFTNVPLSGSSWGSSSAGNFSLLHDETGYFVGRRNDGVNLRYRVDLSEGAYFPDDNMPYTQALGDIVTVVAPEPGTMLALGAGLAALARRRRRKGSACSCSPTRGSIFAK